MQTQSVRRPVRVALKAALFASVSGAWLMAAPAVAQTASGAEAPERASSIEEVVVTARRRAESLQDVPVTVNAFSEKMLEERGIVDLQSLADAAPGVTIDAFPRGAPRAFFRGIGSSNQSAGADPSSVAFIDGVYIGRGPMLAVDIFDMERVEILKGPQGTLWGKNVVGGAINFITAKPEADFGGKLRLTIGDFGQKNANLVVNAPVSDTVWTRIALSSTKNDGFRRNLNSGGALDDDDQISGRIHVLFKLNEDSDLLLSADATKENAAGGARFNLNPFGTKNIDKPRFADPDRPGYLDRKTGGVKAEINSGALGWAKLTGVVSYRWLDFSSSEDLDGTTAANNLRNGVAANGIQTLMEEEADSYSGEARLSSTGEGPLSWVAGLYALKDKVYRERESETAVVDTSENRFIADNVTESYAAFGEVDYELIEGLKVFGGGRYTHERKEYEIRRLIGNPAAPTVDFTTYGDPGIFKDGVFTWRVGGNYRPNENVFVFASVSTGFKSGAFQEQPQRAGARLATAPEKITNYEAGLKSDWWDRRLRVNVSIFKADYNDLQTIQIVPDATQGPAGTRAVTDTGDATIKGLEAEFILLPVRGLELGLNYTYLDATFDQFTQTRQILANGTPVFDDLAGKRLSRTPKNALAGSASYDTPDFSWGSLRFEASFNYESFIFDDNSNSFPEVRKPRTLWDASVTYNIRDDLSLQAWMHNITDVEYRTHQTSTGGGFFVQYGPPRQFGVTLDYRF